MDNRQENKLSMYNVTISVLDKNNAEVSTLPALATAKGDLVSAVKHLRKVNIEQLKSTIGKTQNKKAKKTQLANKTHVLAAAVQAYAAVIDDSDLYELVNYAESTLAAMEDEVLQQACQLVYDTANDHLANLGDYGVTSAMMTELETLITAWNLESQSPRMAIVERSAATKELPDLFKGVDDILLKRTDKLMEQFEHSAPLFYDTYRNARKIVNAGHGPLTETVTGKMVDAVSMLGIAGGMVEVEALGLVVMTDENGVFELPKVPHVEIVAQFSAAGYVLQDVTIDVKKGMDALEVKMQPE